MTDDPLPIAADPQTHAIIGAAMEVHRTLGYGFLEPVCRAAIAIEFAERAIPFRREIELPISYRGRTLPVKYRVDFICYEQILVELKALRSIGPVEQSQVLNYLKASTLRRALLLNFGANSLHFKRMIRDRPPDLVVKTARDE